MYELMDVKRFVLELAEECKYTGNALDDFVIFMENNDWFDIIPVLQEAEGETMLYFQKADAAKRIKENVTFFMSNKDKTLEQKYTILLQKLRDKFSVTAEHIYTFFKKNYVSENIKFQIIDFLLYFLRKDIYLCSNNEMNILIKTVCDNLTLKTGNIFVDFICWHKENYTVKYTIDFKLNSRNTESRVKQAYDNDKYLNLIYYLFNNEYIEENCMYQLASENKNTADAWLYLSLHLICAIRDTDLVRLPHPRLRHKPEDILEKINNNQFADSDALLVMNSVLWQLKNISMVPSKTSFHSGISDIKLIIPDSAMVHFGFLFALAEAHYVLAGLDDRPLIRPVKDYESITRCMGEEIGELFLEENFSTRSANKSYMQAVEIFSDSILDNENTSMPHTKGYMLAALARSHKGSYGEFANTTKVYLKDANFSGLVLCQEKGQVKFSKFVI